ncbi:NADH dehydrogenase (ubiquinone) Fe-S protein 4 [Kwoniella mangroviensis CBS 10435]|uniref:NADH dehydrogenase [ubiquinone] iron-sulfur protein 4, mitochondrial n=1 Tax=Kwoniella mangroviensis CBS 10435 TaxID=1331196 RepID=A0A1B9IKX0_9TREE|nr:NADH dehydrogenase (ubiquinone) Fe-S protein 4 [Kwoniella mangroviensis CBS 10435]
MSLSRSLLQQSARPFAAIRSIHTSRAVFNKPDAFTTPVPTAQPGQNAAAEFDFAGLPQVETVSGAPTEMQYRSVRIYRPTKSTMQSAKGKTKRWLLDWDVLQGAGRWENPLMGWAASADYVQGTSLAFPSKEAAVRYAEKQGWPYKIDEPKKVVVPPKNYGGSAMEDGRTRLERDLLGRVLGGFDGDILELRHLDARWPRFDRA